MFVSFLTFWLRYFIAEERYLVTQTFSDLTYDLTEKVH